jgi:formate dehydrogenase iron-sulfur subunit
MLMQTEEYGPEGPVKIRTKRKLLLVDTTKCTGCRACQLACKEWHNREVETPEFAGTYESPLDLSYNTWIRVLMREVTVEGQPQWLFRPEFCRHCGDAACLNVCPVPECITRDNASGGSIVLDERLCIGCLYCVFSCPFSIPRYRPEGRIVSKCNRCFDRSPAHMKDAVPRSYKSNVPYCVASCPTGALQFGTVDEMRLAADTRVKMLRTELGMQNANTYGLNFLRGTNVFYILNSPSDEDYDLPTFPRMPATVRTWQGLWKPLTFIMAGATILFWLLHYAIIGPVGVKVVEAKEDEEKELTEEEYDRMIRAKRRAGKMKRDVPKGYRPRKRKKGPKKKGAPPARRSRLPGRKSRQEDEDDY